MIRRILIMALSVLSIGAWAQTKTEVNVNSTDGKYHLVIKKDVDGVMSTIDKTYNSVEEMRNDPELADIDLHVFDVGKNAVFIKYDDSDGHNVNVTVEIDGDKEMQFDGEGENNFVFKGEGSGDAEMHEIKVWIDDEGNKHVIKDGKEVDASTWTEEDGQEFNLDESDGAVMFFKKDGNAEFTTEDGELIEIKLDGKNIEDNGNHKMMIFKSSEGDGDGQNITVRVVQEINLHLEDVAANDFNDLPGIDAKSLKMDALNYYPNPNSGKFSLEFKADKRPTTVKITGIDGQEVYSEEIRGFEGSYQKEIDLSSQKPGIYLLQIIQGSRASNKKIVIE